MFLVLARTFKESLINFWRNGWLSVAAVSVLVMSLYVVGMVFIMVMTADNILKNVEDRINVSIYFKSDTDESRILEIKQNLESYSEIKSINYVSKDQALEDFKRNNADEPVIIRSLEEIGENPLLPSLVIKANNPSQYQTISDYVSNSQFKDEVSRVNYGKNKEIISKLNNIIFQIKKIGVILASIFGTVSLLIIFNTIRITIYTHRQEIEVMRLVGASNTFIRLPFIFEGIIYGITAMVFALILLFITLKFATPYISSAIPAQNLMSFYLNNTGVLLGIQGAFGVFLGIASSWIAVRKYLKI